MCKKILISCALWLLLITLIGGGYEILKTKSADAQCFDLSACLTSEDDPEVGSISTPDKWCRGNAAGDQVTCDLDDPLAGRTLQPIECDYECPTCPNGVSCSKTCFDGFVVTSWSCSLGTERVSGNTASCYEGLSYRARGSGTCTSVVP